MKASFRLDLAANYENGSMSRILFIITQSEMGGAQRFLLEFAPYLKERGHQFSVAAGEGDGEILKHFPGSYFIKNLTRGLNPIKDILALFEILRIIRKEKPDILFLQSTKAGFLGSFAAKLYGLRVVYRIGGWSFRDPRPAWMNKILLWMEKTSAPLKDTIIVNSELDRRLAIEKNIAADDKIVKVYNGIDQNALDFLPKEEARKKISNKSQFPNDQTKIVGTIANLYAAKGLEYLIEAAHILSSTHHTPYHIQFIVIGEGREREKLESLIKKYNLKNFTLTGRFQDARRYLKAFDVFVLPSVKEGFPWVVLEAMAAGVPIVATKVGAVSEVIENNKDGFIVRPRDADGLASSINTFLNDKTLAQNIAQNAHEKLKQFSKERMLQESYEALNV